MTLSHSTLERLVEKHSWLETRYLSGGTLSALVQLREPSILRLYTRSGIQTIEAQQPIAVSPHLPGASYTASSRFIYVLARDGLLEIDRLDPQRQLLLPSVTPAAGLVIDPQERWVSSLSPQGTEEFACHLLILDRKNEPQVRFGLLPGVPYAWQWHPTDALILTLLTPRTAVPWHVSRLAIARYEATASGPRLGELNFIQPPEPASDCCLEASFSPCGRYLLGLWRTGDWFQLWRYHLASRHWSQLTIRSGERARPRRRFDTQSFVWPRVGSQILSLRQERGFFHLEILDAENATEAPTIPPLEEYTYLAQPQLNSEGNALSLIGASAQQAPTLIELGWQHNTWQKQRTFHVTQAHDTLALQPEAISWPSFDGQMVHGLLYRDRRRSGPLPLVMPIHGGPSEQVGATWPIKAHAFVQQGYAVLYVNYRGSWGYGYAYHQALAGRWGELEAADVISAIRTLAAANWIDPRRVALWGGDIGGSSVLRILAQYPDIIRAAIAVYPICDWNDYAERCQSLQRAEVDWALGSSRRETRANRSVLATIDRIQSPLALFHGARDPLVPVAHVEAIAASLQTRKIPCWLTIYPEESHAWQARPTLEDYYCKVASFLARFLR